MKFIATQHAPYVLSLQNDLVYMRLVFMRDTRLSYHKCTIE
jgi:hypothetical protein